MPKIYEYDVVGDIILDGLIDTVNSHIKDGWQPFGGFIVSVVGSPLYGDECHFFQPMVRVGDE